MRYLIELKDRIYVTGYESLSFAENIGKTLVVNTVKYSLDSAKKSTENAIKDTSKKVIQKPAEATVG